MPTAEQIHSILDRYRAAASPFSGSSLLGARYRDVPLLASAWAIGHVGLPFSDNGKVTVFGLQLPLPEDTTFVASLRFTSGLKMRIDEILPSPAEATQSAATLSSLLALFRSIQNVQSQMHQGQSQNGAVREFLDSIKIVAEHDRATLTASVPADLVKQLTAATPDEASNH